MKPYSREYVNKTILEFREITGHTRYTLEQMDTAYKALWTVVLNVEEKSRDWAWSWFESLSLEWTMRRSYIETMGLASSATENKQ